MFERIRRRATYANVVSTLALFLVVGGGVAWAALGKNTVKSKQIAPGAVGSSEAKNLAQKDLSFPLGGALSYESAAISLEKNAYTTIATETIDPNKPGSLLAVGTAAIQDNGLLPGPTTLTYRVLMDGEAEDQTYTTEIADGGSAIDPAWFQCDEVPAGPYTVELQVRADFADVSVGDRSLSLIVTPQI